MNSTEFAHRERRNEQPKARARDRAQATENRAEKVRATAPDCTQNLGAGGRRCTCTLAAWLSLVALLIAGLNYLTIGASPLAAQEGGKSILSASSLDRLMAWLNSQQGARTVFILALGLVIFLAFQRFRRTENYRHLSRALTSEVLSNWRLVLLGLTSVVLSLASGWTTWDGMTNFTQNPVLSFLITFGIQGVMLIAAWLIGETFAQSFAGTGTKPAASIIWALFLVAGIVVIAIVAAILWGGQDTAFYRWLAGLAESWANLVGGGVLALLLLAAIIYAVSSHEIIGPYIRGAKVILRNLPLWIMFLSCMAVSVFFSFDSLFSTIFPEDERRRAAELRIQNRVSGVMSDVLARLGQRRAEAREALFRSAAWRDFDRDLTRLVTIATAAPEALQKLKLSKVAAKSAAEEAERKIISRAEIDRDTLAAEKARLSEELAQLRTARRPLEERLGKLKQDLSAIEDKILAALAEAKGEAQGVRGTGRAGRGPIYREKMKLVANLRLDAEELKGRMARLSRELGAMSDRQTAIEKRLAAISERLAALEVARKAAEKRLAVLESSRLGDLAANLDAAGGIETLEEIRIAFRREPKRADFDRIQKLCGSLLATVRTIPELAQKAEGIDCEPEAASEAAARVFALDDAIAAFAANCTKTDKLIHANADATLDFARGCIQSSGLAGNDTAEFRDRINRLALARDDKAHRFVVTVNAFQDGNRLAYLALAIALAIDGLVFMSGLFGANVIRSPLADAPISADRTASQLETTVNNALGPEGAYRYASARLVLDAIHRTSDREGFAGEVSLLNVAPADAARIRNVLSAGATLNLVKIDPERPDHYLIRSEFFEYLNLVCERQLQRDPELREKVGAEGRALESERLRKRASEEEIAHLVKLLEAAAEPYLQASADVVLRLMKPYSGKGPYSNIIDLNERMKKLRDVALQAFEGVFASKGLTAGGNNLHVTKAIKGHIERMFLGLEDTVHQMLNVGAAQHAVIEDKDNPGVYLTTPEFHHALIILRRLGHGRENDPSLEERILERANRAFEEVSGKLADGDGGRRTLPGASGGSSGGFNQGGGSRQGQRTMEGHGGSGPRNGPIIDLGGDGGRAHSTLRSQIAEALRRALNIDAERMAQIKRLRGSERLEKARRIIERVAEQNNALADRVVRIAENKKAAVRTAIERVGEAFGPENKALVREEGAAIEELVMGLAAFDILKEVEGAIRDLKIGLNQAGRFASSGDEEEYGLNEALQVIAEFESRNQMDEHFPELIEAIDRAQKIIANTGGGSGASGTA